MRCAPAVIAAAAVTSVVFVVGCISDRTLAGPEEVLDCAVPVEAIRRGDRLVFIRDFAFLPDTLHVVAGQTVTWINCEPATAEPHTSTADGGQWSSPLLRRGDSFSHTFPAPGVYPYACLPHSAMRSLIRVN